MIHLVAHHLERVSRKLLVLLMVALLSLPLIAAAKRLQLAVDGNVVDVLSYEATVGDLLDQHGVVLAAGDQVLPAPDTPLESVDAITVLRTIDVSLDVDGVVTEHRGTWRTVEGLLADLGVVVKPSQVLRPSPRTVLEDGDVVTVTTGSSVTLVADGETREVATHLRTVEAVLANLGVTVGEADLVSPAMGAPITDGLEILVQRVDFDTVTESVALPFEQEDRETGALFVGQSRVVQEGVEGERLDTYRLMLVDGEGTERELVEQVVVSEPVTRIVEHGTAERPSQEYIDDGSVWYDLARCESGLRWDLNSTYDGGLQFHPDTWSRNKLAGYPDYAYLATPQQQIEVGKVLQRRSGWGVWPSCARKLGLI